MNGAIAWFAKNPVAANLLMAAVIIGGLMTAPTIKQSVFPDFEINYATVTVVYPGASPEEIEKAVTVRIEEEIQDIAGIEEITSSANEGATNLIIELETGVEISKVLDEIESRVDGITTFPEEIEEPIVAEVVFKSEVLDVAIHGEVDERSLKRIGQKVRDEIVLLPGVSQAELVGTRNYEISIEVSETALQSYGLRFEDVVAAVRRSSLDMPGGSLRTRGGEILLRTDNQAYWQEDFESIPLLVRGDGVRVSVGNVARVVDGFDENEKQTFFDGEPGVFVRVYRTGEQQALAIASEVHAYLDRTRPSMPQGVSLTVWDDDSRYLADRIDMMLRNARNGFLLVIGLLALFLKLRVAIWVAVGLPVAVCGALLVMPWIGIDINILTVFSFIMALGILVDDAIVTGENVYTHQQKDPDDPLGAAIRGTQEIATPVVFGVLTTVAAFAPFAMIEGHARFMAVGIGGVMCVALMFSLIESKLVLPSHLAHAAGAGEAPKRAIPLAWARIQGRINDGLYAFIDRVYAPAVRFCVEWRYVTLATSFSIFLLALATVNSGIVKSTMTPALESDNVKINLKMPLGTPISETREALAMINAALEELRVDLEAERKPDEPPIMSNVLMMVGTQVASGPSFSGGGIGQSNLGHIRVELSPSEQRSIRAQDIAARLQKYVGTIPGAEELTFRGQMRNFGDPIDIELAGRDVEELELVAGKLVHELQRFPGLRDIRDSHLEGKQELHVEVLPSAEVLGLTASDIGRQVRSAFYGSEAQRIQRGQDEVKVMVRYPESERRSLADVDNMRIRLPDGTGVPFSSVASVSLERGPASLLRRNRMRRVNVTADMNDSVVNGVEVNEALETRILPKILDGHPDVLWSFRGEESERREAMGSVYRGFIVALLAIFTLIAIPLRSYSQAIVIMLAIPFGYVGSVLGHFTWGIQMSFLSITGVMACAGVVVNDSIVLVTFMNRLREQGNSAYQAAVLAGQRRFRAIMLTSLTTFAGLVPIMMERTTQAQMVIPMAISLAYGVLVATFFTLLLIPSAMMIVEDLKAAPAAIRNWAAPKAAAAR